MFSCVFCSTENVPVRNSDVDYRLLEAAKAGDLDTVKVFTVMLSVFIVCVGSTRTTGVVILSVIRVSGCGPGQACQLW